MRFASIFHLVSVRLRMNDGFDVINLYVHFTVTRSESIWMVSYDTPPSCLSRLALVLVTCLLVYLKRRKRVSLTCMLYLQSVPSLRRLVCDIYCN